jgi:hypothetical protein
MLTYILLGIIKVIDNVILTAKSLATYKGMKIISSILVIISQLLFYLVIDQVINDSTMLAIIIVSISSGIGNYIAFLINDKFKKDSKWTFFLTSSDKDDVLRLCNYLVEHNIKYLANHGLNRKGQETINVIAYSKTKDQSRLIEKYLKNTNSKYLKEINR